MYSTAKRNLTLATMFSVAFNRDQTVDINTDFAYFLITIRINLLKMPLDIRFGDIMSSDIGSCFSPQFDGT